MKRVKLFIASSIDGYIARKDDSLDWLDSFEGEAPEQNQEDYGYLKFISGIDTLVMGSSTYKVVMGMGVEWPYKEDSYIVSHGNVEINSPKTYLLDANQLEKKIDELKKKEGKDIWLVGGGKLISTFLNMNLVDEMILSIIPVLLGSGIPLFPIQEHSDLKFQLVESQSFKSGVINLHYKKTI